MVAGATGTGKASFINTLFNNHLISITKPRTSDINVYSVEMPNEEHKRKKTSVILVPGLGSAIDDTELHETILLYLRQQFDSFLEEETKIRRNPNYIDTRVNVLVYFICANRNGMRPADIDFLKKVCGMVNILPVIAKADLLTE